MGCKRVHVEIDECDIACERKRGRMKGDYILGAVRDNTGINIVNSFLA